MAFYSSPASEQNVVLKASPGMLKWAYWGTNPSGLFLMLFDATMVPVDGPVTQLAVMFGTGVFPHAEGEAPLFFQNGIVLAISTTGPFTKTTPGGSGFFRAEFE